MDKEVILVIRRNKEYWYNNEFRPYIPPEYSKIMDLWNLSFDLKIMNYRNKMRDIAASTYLKNKFDKIFLHSHKDPRRIKKYISLEEKKMYENSIIVPMDEDDWLSPSLATTLRGIETDKKFFVWNYYNWYGHIKMPFQYGLGKKKVETCSWGIKGYDFFLNRRNNLKIQDEEEFLQVYFIRKPMTVKVDHVGSLGYFRKVIKKYPNENDWINAIVKRLAKQISYEIDVPDSFQDQWNSFCKLLKDLLSSYKYLKPWHEFLLENK